jgi:hypothetical protein
MTCARDVPIPVVFSASTNLDGEVACCTVLCAGSVELRRLSGALALSTETIGDYVLTLFLFFDFTLAMKMPCSSLRQHGAEQAIGDFESPYSKTVA